MTTTNASALRTCALLAFATFGEMAWAQDCAGARDLRASQLTGTWTVFKGGAQVSGAPMLGGSDKVSVQSSGGGITLEIEGQRFSLNRVPDSAAAWKWEAGGDVKVSSDGFELVLGCDNDRLARFEGSQKVAGQLVTWRFMAETDRDAHIYWSFAGPPAAAGLFSLTK